jgi:quinohemoprotein ethanol dehydrogenase
LYVLDRHTGQFLSAKPFVKRITWASEIDAASGRRVELLTAHKGMEAVLVSPAPGGGHNWYPIAARPVAANAPSAFPG